MPGGMGGMGGGMGGMGGGMGGMGGFGGAQKQPPIEKVCCFLKFEFEVIIIIKTSESRNLRRP